MSAPRVNSSSIKTSGATASLGLNSTARYANELSVVMVSILSATVTVTSITAASGTWVLAKRQVGTTTTTEVWVGYGHVGTALIATAALSASAAVALRELIFDCGSPQSTAPTLSAVGAAATSTTIDPTAVTPAVDDLVVVAYTDTTTAAAVASDTPAGYVLVAEQTASTARQGGAWRAVTSAVSHDHTLTITSNAWSAVQVVITQITAAALAGFGYKGRDTYTLDNGSAA